MAKFGFGDFITLAKSGWTPEAFNSALDRIESMNAAEESNEDESHESESESNESESESHENESESHESKSESPENEKDKEIADLKKQLAAAQAHNRKQDNSGGEKKSLDDLVDDIFTEFFN